MNAKECGLMFASFRTLIKAYNDFVEARMQSYGLSPNEIAVLASLDSVSTASVIARDAGVSKALVSRSVKSLKEKGLIEISISEIDKREQNLKLTEEGSKVAGIISDVNERFCEVAMRDTNKKALDITTLMLEIIIKNLIGEGD